MGKGGSGWIGDGGCNAERRITERCAPPEVSPLGGGRSGPQVRRCVQLRARPGDADCGVCPGRGQRGANTPGVDGLTAADVEQRLGVPGFLDGLRVSLKEGSFRPLPVRERRIPKPGGSGKLRKLGIPTIADRVVQAALKLVLEPIFEADFLPVSYGFRPKRRAQDAIAEIHMFGSRGYQWVLDADIEACFDSIDHTALTDRVRHRIKDKRVLHRAVGAR
jgi:retron-type reverse transcriptase